MKVIVTGGAGFIGSHVVEKLIEHGYKVIIVDNLSSMKRHYVHTDATFYQIDIGSKELRGVFATERPDYVIHLAAQINSIQSLANSVKDANINISGTVNLLQCVKDYPVQKFVYASSAAVYGEPVNLPIDESHPIVPTSFYGLSKYVAEIYLRLFSSMFGIDYVILRYPNVYGPRQDSAGEAGVISIFANQILAGENTTIFGDGVQTRDFVYVEDVAEANLIALLEGHMDAFNISCNYQTSILELAGMMSEITKRKFDPEFQHEHQVDIVYSALANRKAEQILGWRPSTTLYAGLEKTIRSQMVPTL